MTENKAGKDKISWTPEQREVIDTRGKNILVSAGAGSGKTQVMIERIAGLIINDGASISNMLVVTFTNAAAGEMRDRLRTRLKDEFAERIESGGDAARIREELDLLQGADISTFHSFAKRVINEFFYIIGLEPGYRVVDEAEKEVMMKEAMDDLMRDLYEEKDPGFIDFLDSYSGDKSDDDVRSMIKSLYTKLEVLPDGYADAERLIGELDIDPEGFKETSVYKELLSAMQGDIDNAISMEKAAESMLSENGLNGLEEKIKKDRDTLTEASGELTSSGPDSCLTALKSIKWAVLSAGKDEKEEYQLIQDRITAFRKGYKDLVKQMVKWYGPSVDDNARILKHTSKYASELLSLVKRFDEAYSEIKKDRKVIDFGDMEHFALEILRHEEVRDYYRDRFSHIFIDEYQDTNIMQETIIDLIKRDDDLFMVGDLKQSIYRFRLADPELFRRRYRRYKEEGGEKSVAIDLNTNFRSKSAVIDGINRIFSPIMEGYDEGQALVPGIEGDGIHEYDVKTYVIEKPRDPMKDGEIDEELREMAIEEVEARQAVRVIKENLGKEYYDPRSKEVKTFGLKDFVILMRTFKGSVDAYLDVFRKAGIPLYVDDTDGYFDTIEINVFLSLLSVIDNKYQDIPFISLLRSEVFGFSVTELLSVRKYQPEGSYVEAAMDVAGREDAPGELREKLCKVFSSIEKWKALAVTMPLPDLIWKLLNDTGYYMVAGALPGGERRQANLRLLVERASDYAGYSQGSLYGFIRYIDTVKMNDVRMPQATLISENDDVVRLMTIHHSKGLEYRMVIVAGCGRSTRGNSISKVSFDRETGLALRAVLPEKHLYQNTLTQNLIARKENVEEEEELKRVFYVAATRAKEGLFLIGTVTDYEKFGYDLKYGVKSGGTLFGVSEYLPGIIKVDAAELAQMDLGEGAPEIKDASIPQSDIAEFVDQRLSYEYPFAGSREQKGKISVTEINEARAGGFDKEKEDAVSEVRMPVPGFLRGKKKLTAAEKGTIYHGIMERIDPVKAEAEGIAYIESFMEELAGKGIFKKEELDDIDPGRVKAFFDTEVGKRMAAACSRGALRREQPFESRTLIKGEEILVQGIIDCYFEENGDLILLDYKTNHIDKEKGVESEIDRIRSTYRAQMEIYRKALSEATGKKIEESYLYLFDLGDTIVV